MNKRSVEEIGEGMKEEEVVVWGIGEEGEQKKEKRDIQEKGKSICQ